MYKQWLGFLLYHGRYNFNSVPTSISAGRWTNSPFKVSLREQDPLDGDSNYNLGVIWESGFNHFVFPFLCREILGKNATEPTKKR